jgi:hypothetical protein
LSGSWLRLLSYHWGRSLISCISRWIHRIDGWIHRIDWRINSGRIDGWIHRIDRRIDRHSRLIWMISINTPAIVAAVSTSPRIQPTGGAFFKRDRVRCSVACISQGHGRNSENGEDLVYEKHSDR